MGNIITGPKTQKKIENLEVLVGRPSSRVGYKILLDCQNHAFASRGRASPFPLIQELEKTDDVLHNFRNLKKKGNFCSKRCQFLTSYENLNGLGF